jgi:hypothetical protein
LERAEKEQNTKYDKIACFVWLNTSTWTTVTVSKMQATLHVHVLAA